MRLKYLEDLKHQESYGSCFWSLNSIKKGMTDNFTVGKTVRKTKVMYLDVMCLEAKKQKGKSD